MVAIDFADVGGKTKMTFTQSRFVTDGDRAGVEGGWSEALAKLAEKIGK